MSNSDFAATMYESDPMVVALNKVPGFDPLKLMSRKRMPGAEKDEKSLDFRYKKLWFRLAHRTGRIRLNRLSITEQIAIIEAQVYLEMTDANPVSSFIATCSREEAGDKYIESAQIKAMDQALTDAGFGLQFVPAPVGNTGNIASQTAADSAAVPKTVQQAVVQQKSVTLQQATVQQKTVHQAAVQQHPAVTQQATAQQPVVQRQTAASQQKPMTQQRTVQQRPVTVQQQSEALQQRPTAVQQQTVTRQAVVSVRSAQTTQAQRAQSGQKVVAGSAQTQEGMQKAAVNPVASTVPQKSVTPTSTAAQMTVKQPIGAETLPADQLPVTAGQSLPVTLDLAAAMSMLSGKGEANTLPVAPEGAKAVEKTETIAEELPVTSVNVTVTTPPAQDIAIAAEMISTTLATPSSAVSTDQAAKETMPYTETSPVDQILQFMTLEDAKKVIVPTGTCRGWTLDEVAQRRRPSLRYYLSQGYQGKDNVLRAAAKLILDDLEKKAG